MQSIFDSVVLLLPVGVAFAALGCGIVTRKVDRAAIPVCARCDYDLDGLQQPRCPECGGKEREYRFTISHHIEWPRALFSVILFPMLLTPGVVACLVWAWFVELVGFSSRSGWILATKPSDRAPIQSLWFACYVQSQVFLLAYVMFIARFRRGWRYAVQAIGVTLCGLVGMIAGLALAWFGLHTTKWSDLSIVAILSPPAWGAACGMLVGYLVLRRCLREPVTQPATTPKPEPGPR